MAKETKNTKTMKTTLEGVEYTFQKVGLRPAFQMRERWTKTNGTVDQLTMIDEVLENIVIDPRVTLDNFEEYPNGMEIVEELVIRAWNFQAVGKPIA